MGENRLTAPTSTAASLTPTAPPIPAAALLEGGYSDDLPLLVEAFLGAWEKPT